MKMGFPGLIKKQSEKVKTNRVGLLAGRKISAACRGEAPTPLLLHI